MKMLQPSSKRLIHSLLSSTFRRAVAVSSGCQFSFNESVRGTSSDAANSDVKTGSAGETALLHHIKTKIMMRGGPISLAEYMQDALTSPHGGFYMGRDVFGTAGDFTTSPEISQMFGEMLGAWAAYTWMQAGKPAKVLYVELGPGRGTLAADIMRATAGFKGFAASVEIHLVEVSPALRAAQWSALRCTPAPPPTMPAHHAATAPSAAVVTADSSDQKTEGVCGFNGAKVTWHHTLDTVPRTAPMLCIAHEFFDALPVHQFVHQEKRGWVEKLVDVIPDPVEPADSTQSQQPGAPEAGQGQGQGAPVAGSGSSREGAQGGAGTTPGGERDGYIASSSSGLRLVLSPGPTPAAALLVGRRLAGMSEEEKKGCNAVEVSAHGMAAAEALALRLGTQGGCALVVDYGQDGPYADSLMAIKQHQGVKVLDAPGSADLSAWVDFGAIRHAALGAAASAASAPRNPLDNLHLKHSASATAPASATILTSTPGSPGAAAAAAGAALGSEAGAGSAAAAVGGSRALAGPVSVWGPVSQGSFLLQLGIAQRLEVLLRRASPDQADALRTGFQRLTDESSDQGMGRTYQVMAITLATAPPPAGFEGGKHAEGSAHLAVPPQAAVGVKAAPSTKDA